MSAFPALSIRGRSLLPLSTGLAITQAIATLFVWQSNRHLARSVEAITAAGWLAIPAGPAAAGLHSFAAAFWGGLFFTLSIGTGLTLATWAALFVWGRLSGLRRSAHPVAAMIGRWCAMAWLGVITASWLVAAYKINAKGVVLFPTLFLLCTPMATAAAALRRAPVKVNRLWSAPLMALVLLTGLWYSQLHPLDETLFLAVRDRLLLSSPVGKAVNDFYYRYTLYAAQTFKPFGQKETRACTLVNLPDTGTDRRLTLALSRFDVLAVAKGTRTDLVVAQDGGVLRLASPRGDAVAVKLGHFLRDPGEWLRRFSEISDRFAAFRRMTFISLVLGFPVLLFILADGAIGRAAALFVRDPARTWVRSCLCLVFGVMLLIPIWSGRPVALQKSQIGAALADEAWPRRVAALRLIEREKIEIADYPQYRELLKSDRLVERYYVARALGVSRADQTYEDLLAMTADSQPNVVCQAYYALGERRNRRAVAVIQTQIVQSGHWYTQWYGYRALKRLGWRQNHLKSIP